MLNNYFHKFPLIKNPDAITKGFFLGRAGGRIRARSHSPTLTPSLSLSHSRWWNPFTHCILLTLPFSTLNHSLLLSHCHNSLSRTQSHSLAFTSMIVSSTLLTHSFSHSPAVSILHLIPLVIIILSIYFRASNRHLLNINVYLYNLNHVTIHYVKIFFEPNHDASL